MAKVDWITWKTDCSEIINPKVTEDVNTNIQKFTNIMMNDIYKSIEREKTTGGLNEKSLNLNGVSPSSLNSDKILSKIESVLDDVNSLKKMINKQVQEQKEIEKNQLITAIKEKITEQERILDNTKKLRERINSSNEIVSVQDVDNIIETTSERIKFLTNKLTEVEAL